MHHYTLKNTLLFLLGLAVLISTTHAIDNSIGREIASGKSLQDVVQDMVFSDALMRRTVLQTMRDNPSLAQIFANILADKANCVMQDLYTCPIEPTMKLEGKHKGKVLCLANHLGKIISGSADSKLCVWDQKSYAHEKTVEQNGEIRGVVSLWNNTILGAGVWSLEEYNGDSYNHTRTLQEEGRDRNFCLTTDTENIYVGSSYRVHVLDGNTYKPTGMLEGHADYVRCVTTDQDNIVSGDDSGELCIWDKKTHVCKALLEVNERWVRSVAVHQGNIIAGTRAGYLHVWDGDTYEHVCLLNGHTDAVSCVTPRGKDLISGSYDGTLCVWRHKKGQEYVLRAVLDGNKQNRKRESRIYSVLVSKWDVVAGHGDGSLSVWKDLPTASYDDEYKKLKAALLYKEQEATSGFVSDEKKKVVLRSCGL